jgi:hypothetical protein
MMPPDPHVTPKRMDAEPGDVVTDADGSQWRIVHVFSNGVSRVRVGSLADGVIFGETDAV